MIFETVSIENPRILLLTLMVIPAFLFIFARYRKIKKNLGASSSSKNDSALFRPAKRSLLWRTIFRCFSWIFAVLAFAEISWGAKKVPVHKSGSNVNFVFDISYSMLAEDGPQKKSRLECVKIYVTSLLQELSSSSFSAVLAKGSGFVAIPETEDAALMGTLIENLSPALMTSAGSSLGNGIEAALNAIPEHSSKSQYIWVFTDGDETDSLLEKALEKCAKNDVAVTIVGFGTERETEIVTGDGKNRVRTALRSEEMEAIARTVSKRNYRKSNSANESIITFIDSKSTGSAWKLLNQIKTSRNGEESTLSYEVKQLNHHSLFILLSILSLIFSFIAGEFRRKNSKEFKNLAAATMIFSAMFLTSCSSEKKQVLDGVWAWYEGKFTSATAHFLNTAQKAQNDSMAKSFAIFDLSATYLSIGELDAAMERLSQLNLDDKNLPPELRSAAYYNRGVILERQGEYSSAAESFKKAILANQKNLNAKINLELCKRELTEKQSKSVQAQMQGVNEEKAANSEMNNEIFNLIREQEGKKWRNMSDGGENNNDVLDY